MKKVLIGVMFGLFLFGVGIASSQAEEHTKEYLEWESKTINSMKLGTRCLEVKKEYKGASTTALRRNTAKTVVAWNPFQIILIGFI